MPMRSIARYADALNGGCGAIGLRGSVARQGWRAPQRHMDVPERSREDR